MNKTTKILVTGATGLIGSYLIRKLVNKGYTNISAIILPDDSSTLIADASENIKWCVADVTDQVSMDEYFVGIDTVIHCAGMISFWKNEFKQMYDVNVTGTNHVVNLCLEHEVRQLIHLSSIEALGKSEDGSPMNEKNEWKEEMQHTQYANTKYLGELEVWRGNAEGLNTIIYNPALVLGTGFWNSGPMKMIKDIYQGLDYYPKGSIAVMDVRDLADLIISNLDKSSLYGNRMILGSYNKSYQELMNGIATHLKVAKPSKLLQGATAQLAIVWEHIKSLFTNTKPLINKETFLVSNEKLEYSFEKLHAQIEFSPIPFEKTIADMCLTFLDSQTADQDYGIMTHQ